MKLTIIYRQEQNAPVNSRTDIQIDKREEVSKVEDVTENGVRYYKVTYKNAQNVDTIANYIMDKTKIVVR